MPVWGKPMLYWAIRACKLSKYIDECYVSTEDQEIADVARGYEAQVIVRPADLANDIVFKQDVIVHGVQSLKTKPQIIVSLQANSPEICAKDLDDAIEKFIKTDRNEIFSVNEELIQNAAFRIMKYDYVFQKSISTRSGVFVTPYLDVHSAKDVEMLEEHRQPCGGNSNA
jgi:CMP-N-acetylneuraminic acid synthetase